MSMHPMGPMKKPKQQVKVDLGQAETLQCEKCYCCSFWRS